MRALALMLVLGFPAAAFGAAAAWKPPFKPMPVETSQALRRLGDRLPADSEYRWGYGEESELKLGLLGALNKHLKEGFLSRAQAAIDDPKGAKIREVQSEVYLAYRESRADVENAVQEHIDELSDAFAARRISGHDLIAGAKELGKIMNYSPAVKAKANAFHNMAVAAHFGRTLERAHELAEGLIQGSSPDVVFEAPAIFERLSRGLPHIHELQ